MNEATSKNIKHDLKHLYKLRSDFLVIGLTGRQGSGCSTVANFLTSTFENIKFPKPVTSKFSSNEERKYRIAYRYLKENWEEFTLIRASDVIVSLILEKEYEELIAQFDPDLVAQFTPEYSSEFVQEPWP